MISVIGLFKDILESNGKEITFLNAYRFIAKNLKIFYLNINNNISVDNTTKISKKAKLGMNGKINVGKNCSIHDFVELLPYGGFILIGDNCSVNPFSILYGQGGLTIGKNVRIAAHTVIIPANHKYNKINIPITKQGSICKGITIGDDVWVGANCTILDGVKIRKGSVIGAGSVVTKSFPSYSVIAGNPAKKIKSRK